MPTIAVLYEKGKLGTIELKGHFRGIAWDPKNDYATLVGDNGRVLRVFSDQTLMHLESGTEIHLRGISVNPKDGSLLIAGNAGALFTLSESMTKIQVPTFENLRTVSWNAQGTTALIGGNSGVLLKYANASVHSLGDGRANLRRIAWHPHDNRALITSNCFAEQFVPSPNLFLYDSDKEQLRGLNESQADFVGVDWEPNGESALVAGYDVVWHTGFIGQFIGTELRPLQFENKQVYPVTVAWDPAGKVAAICTAIAQPGMGTGSIRLWNGQEFTTVFESDHYYFSTGAWNRHGTLLALASPINRAFNC
jgi:hypothetical protein